MSLAIVINPKSCIEILHKFCINGLKNCVTHVYEKSYLLFIEFKKNYKLPIFPDNIGNGWNMSVFDWCVYWDKMMQYLKGKGRLKSSRPQNHECLGWLIKVSAWCRWIVYVLTLSRSLCLNICLPPTSTSMPSDWLRWLGHWRIEGGRNYGVSSLFVYQLWQLLVLCRG